MAADFFFVGGGLALDFSNTEIMVRGAPVDLLRTPADLEGWWERAALHHELGRLSEPANPRLLDAAITLRRALRRLFEALAGGRDVDPSDLAALNHVLGAGRPAVELSPDGTLHATYRGQDAAPEGALLPIALSARQVLTSADRGRLHRCDNSRCVLLFYDTTKSATRRWCSLGCMNRARSSRRYRERKAARAV